MNFLNGRHAKVLTVLIILQGSMFYAVAFRKEATPPVSPLSTFPLQVNEWQCTRDIPIEADVQELLKADDTLNRIYTNTANNESAFLFVAFFKTQRYGQSPHSPKNCLPGSGWAPVETGSISIDVPQWQGPISANKYVVQHGDQKDVVIYWYQSHNRIVSDEYAARFWLVLDAIRYNRSDTSIVKVVVPVERDNVTSATDLGVKFIKAMFPRILQQLPI